MNIYLLRHANALEIGENGIETDEERPLNDEGRQRLERLAGALKKLEVTFDEIQSSPLTRALQTAQELCRHLGKPESLIVPTESLAPGYSSKKLVRHLLSLEAQNVLLVGHEPSLGKHAAWLIGSRRATVEFGKAGMAFIRCEMAPQKGAGALVWLLTAKVVEGLTGATV